MAASKKTIAATSTELIAADADRRGIIIENTDASTAVWFALGEAAVVNEGFSLAAGQKVALSQYTDKGLNAYSLQIFGISATGNVVIAYQTL